MKPGGTRTGATLAVFSFTLFLAAGLMFAVEPMTGKMLLPLVGGTPAGWIVAMAFFQVMVLLGYLLAHALSRLTPRQQGWLYIAALAAGAPFLPISLGHHDGLDTLSGPGKVFLLLTEALAIPFIALSATSSTLQRLFTTTRHGSAGDPYFLYAASNLGSFAGLLLYPFVIEPLLPLDRQSDGVAGGYVLLMALAALCLLFSGSSDQKKGVSAPRKHIRHLGWKRQAEWLALAFLPSALLMSVTTYITSDIISAPLIWILPLALYLLTFVIAFSRKPVVSLRLMEGIQPYVICVAIIFISLLRADWLFSWLGVASYLAVFTAVALACHMRLASLRPLDDGRQLTSYYVMMSVGGALGGVLNAFVIPVIFNRLIEFPLFLLASFLVHEDFKARSRTGMAILALMVLCVVLVDVPPLAFNTDMLHARRVFFEALSLGAIALAGYAIFYRSLSPPLVILAAFGIFMMSQFVIGEGEFLSVRNFFGTVRLYDSARMEDGKPLTVRTMRHGSTTHGIQMRGDPALETLPTAYFTKQGPLGDVFAVAKPHDVAVLGLGAGVTNCFNAKDRSFTFFEIDPDVVDVAENDFTFLKKCPGKKPYRVFVGDGRLELARLPDKFDLLIVDVFTSDTIPTHIVTQEALKMYFDHIAPGGTLAMNISNRYFSLWDTIATTASTLGLVTAIKRDVSPNRPFYSSPSVWMIMGKPPLSAAFAARGWKPVTPTGRLKPWTDNYTNLLAALSSGGALK